MTFRGDWKPDFVQYNPGEVVRYNGKNYKNIQGHRSQADWPPSNVPALWAVTDDNCGPPQPHQQQYQAPPQQQQYQQPPPQQQGGYQQPPPQQGGYSYGQAPSGNQPQHPVPHDATKPQGGYTTESGAKIDEEDTKKKWYDLDDDKKGVLAAGGLAVGLAALAGGYYAHKKKEERDEEEVKQEAWELQNWIIASRKRTEAFFDYGAKTPTTWLFNEAFDRPNLRNDLIPGGQEDGQPWFIARAPKDGGLQIGKGRPDLGAFIGYKNEAVRVKQFELLVGNPQAVRWVRTSGKLDANSLRARLVEGGHESYGVPLAIARARVGNDLLPGKASSVLNGAYVVKGDDEVPVKDYEVLVYV